MANVLTAEYVEQSTRAINSWLGGESGFVNELRDSHEAIRAERDEARREREEWRKRAEKVEEALREAEHSTREFTLQEQVAYCRVCRSPSAHEPHTDACPFHVLAMQKPAGETG